MNIRLFKPSLGEAELAGIKSTFDISWVGLGEKVIEFENAWSAFIGSKASIGVNSATAALHLAVQAYRFPEGKKVMVPAVTFAATAFAPVYNRLEPVFVDVDDELISLSVEDMERKYDPDVVAIIPVHFSGHPARMKEIMDFARRKNLKVIEDCAHTAGNELQGKKLGTWGDIGCFSFEEKKCMTTGDGGMICSDDTDLMNEIKPSRWLGINKDAWVRQSQDQHSNTPNAHHWDYDISMLGFKYNMNNLAASIGLVQLKRLPDMNERRRQIVQTYMEGIRGLRMIRPLLAFDPEKYAYQMFGIRCEQRDQLILFLKSRGIATGVHYEPLYRHSFFSTWSNHCPVSDRIWTSFITLPLHADLTDEELDYVINALHEADRSMHLHGHDKRNHVPEFRKQPT